MVNHLSQIETLADLFHIHHAFPNEYLLHVHDDISQFIDMVNYLVAYVLTTHLTKSKINKLKSKSKYYV